MSIATYLDSMFLLVRDRSPSLRELVWWLKWHVISSDLVATHVFHIGLFQEGVAIIVIHDLLVVVIRVFSTIYGLALDLAWWFSSSSDLRMMASDSLHFDWVLSGRWIVLGLCLRHYLWMRFSVCFSVSFWWIEHILEILPFLSLTMSTSAAATISLYRIELSLGRESLVMMRVWTELRDASRGLNQDITFLSNVRYHIKGLAFLSLINHMSSSHIAYVWLTWILLRSWLIPIDKHERSIWRSGFGPRFSYIQCVLNCGWGTDSVVDRRILLACSVWLTLCLCSLGPKI
jgi:hypothetical protein